MKRIASLATAFFLLFSAAQAFGQSVQVAEKPGVGKYLTDAKGMTLYIFKKDSPGTSACTGTCLENWPLFHVQKVKTPKGLKAKNFGTITRKDGKTQTTYKKLPLYYFAQDTQPGDVKGEGLKGLWYVAKP